MFEIKLTLDEIKLTLDATPALIGALQDLAGAIHDAVHPVTPYVSGPMPSKADIDRLAELEKDGTDEKAPNLPSEAPTEAERPETPENVEEPKKRKSRAKKAPSESNTPAAPAEEAPAPAPEPAPEIVTPAPAEPAPVVVHLDGTDPLAGKGQTGEILAELTRKAIGDLDALGVDRGDANRRIRDYCARNEIKFPTFPAVLQAVGYAEAIAICKGA